MPENTVPEYKVRFNFIKYLYVFLEHRYGHLTLINWATINLSGDNCGEASCKLWGCKLALEMFHLTEEDLIDELDGVITVGEFYERAAVEGSHIVFV